MSRLITSASPACSSNVPTINADSPEFTFRQLRRQNTFSPIAGDACKLVGLAEISEDMKIADVERRLVSKYAQLPADEVSSVVHSAPRSSHSVRSATLCRCSSSATHLL